ncbi:unnamed protein product [Clonostachys chloroleuca]|uniref:Uncharacterized protein n=1 Tax=Clonostachys chloroleuca TaxID=1926264 RepID=A0AA35MHL6_9HYPO|nr:unnamed protein product [Clonostachys chloroleuca]
MPEADTPSSSPFTLLEGTERIDPCFFSKFVGIEGGYADETVIRPDHPRTLKRLLRQVSYSMSSVNGQDSRPPAAESHERRAASSHVFRCQHISLTQSLQHIGLVQPLLQPIIHIQRKG